MVLEIVDLEFGYTAEERLFSAFSLTIKSGEITALTGPSGSGKSTLLELIGGRLKPKRGYIKAAAFSQIFQDPYTSFHPTYTIANQIADTASLQGAKELCERLLIDHELLGRRPHELSGGQLQRLSILRALLMKPQLILADEPTSALDNLAQLEVMKLIVSLTDRVGVLLITHDRTLAKWCADRIVEIGNLQREKRTESTEAINS
ncbi:MAG: ATP-binding cassette domain-containing protein [Helicobacteraceae bacterium]|jgi:peptide/nickel transport system ATP-binding protein|nr:ATP-binding cassette domain-containing protein [Helicobacteraceae bacterium]